MSDERIDLDFDDYQARITAGTLAEVLKAWHWLPLAALRPVGVTLFGDVFFIDASNAVYFLDVSFGVLEKVALTSVAFGERLQDPAFSVPMLRLPLATELLQQHELEDDHVYGFVMPLIGGGPPVIENIAPLHVGEYLGMLGQLTEGLVPLPVGTAFQMKFEDLPGEDGQPAPLQALLRAERDRTPFAI